MRDHPPLVTALAEAGIPQGKFANAPTTWEGANAFRSLSEDRRERAAGDNVSEMTRR
jgi:hypothetical protein